MEIEIITANTDKFDKEWKILWEESKKMNALYSENNLKYYLEVCDKKIQDKSFIIKINDISILGIRMTVCIEDNLVARFHCNEFLPIIYLEKNNIDPSLKRKGISIARDNISKILSQYKDWEWIHKDEIERNQISELSHYFLNEHHAEPLLVLNRVIDLCLDEEVIFKRLSKGYKYNIKWGLKNLQTKILIGKEFKTEDLERFRALHYKAAGRETRSKRSWEIQKTIVNQNQGFVVIAENKENDLVSAALFLNSKKHCFYGVSASDRTLFKKPISHVVIWEGIKQAKRMGCLEFELGSQAYSYQKPKPTDKELNISDFKRKFGTSTNAGLTIKANSKTK